MRAETTRRPIHASKGDVGFRHRSAFSLLTACNGKTPKGEKVGYFTATLYLMPHTSGGGATLCPQSTPTCRAMCLSGSGLSGLPKAMGAKQRRTDLFNNDRPEFLRILAQDVMRLIDLAEDEGLKPALRLNATSDILWERIVPWWSDLAPLCQRYDYTKHHLHHRRTDPGYHLTYSIGGREDYERAIGYLRAGHSVAVVVPEEVKASAPDEFMGFPVIDGDETDLRFLDPPGSIVLLKPKGHIRTGLVRPKFFAEMARLVSMGRQ